MTVREPDVLAWPKGSYSGDNGDCVEVGWPASAGVAVRDSKCPDGPTPAVPTPTWHTFLGRLP